MTDADYDAIATEAFRLIDEVALPSVNGREDALDTLKRVAGLEREVTLMLIVRGLEAAKGLIDETTEVCAYFMLLGAILGTEHQRRSRIISIEKAKRALPDESFVDGGTCPKCGGSWVGSPTCPKCGTGEATAPSAPASKDGQ